MKHDAPIAIPADLQALFEIPSCELISLPSAEPLRVRLPTGGELKAFADLSKGIPTDCSLSLNLMLQLAPLLANMKCLLSVVGLVKPVQDILDALQPKPLPNIPKALGAVPDVATAFGKFVTSCIAPFLPPYLPVALFLIDLLNVILKLLRCMIGELRTVLGIMQGITLQLDQAQAAGNQELVQVLECARENAARSAEHTAASIGPVGSIFELLTPLLGLFGLSVTIPGPGGSGNTAALQQTIERLDDVVTSLEAVVEVLEQVA